MYPGCLSLTVSCRHWYVERLFLTPNSCFEGKRMFVYAIVFCERSMLLPLLSKHYPESVCIMSVIQGDNGSWVLLEAHSYIMQKWIKSRGMLTWNPDLYVISLLSSTSLFLNQSVILTNLFWGRIVWYFPTFLRGWNCITESLFSVFSAFCLLFCQGSSALQAFFGVFWGLIF